MAEHVAGARKYWGFIVGVGALCMVVAGSMVLLTGSQWWFVGTVAGGVFSAIGLV